MFSASQERAFDEQLEARFDQLRDVTKEESSCHDLRIGRELTRRPRRLLGLVKVTSCLVIRKTGMTGHMPGFYERRTTSYPFVRKPRVTYSDRIFLGGRGYDFYHFPDLYEIGLDDVMKAIDLLRAKVPA